MAAELPVAEGARLADSASTAFTDALGIEQLPETLGGAIELKGSAA